MLDIDFATMFAGRERRKAADLESIIIGPGYLPVMMRSGRIRLLRMNKALRERIKYKT